MGSFAGGLPRKVDGIRVENVRVIEGRNEEQSNHRIYKINLNLKGLMLPIRYAENDKVIPSLHCCSLRVAVKR